jgi:hypothetical protein
VAIKLKIKLIVTRNVKVQPQATKALRNSIVVVKQIFVLELNSLTAKLAAKPIVKSVFECKHLKRN